MPKVVKNTSSATATKVAGKNSKGSSPAVENNVVAREVGFASLVLKQIRHIAQLYGFESIEPPILEDEKVYSDFYKNQPDILGKVVKVQASGKSLGVRTALLPSLLKQFAQNKVNSEVQQIHKWMSIGYAVASDVKKGVSIDHQYVFEVLGAFTHLTEAQVISAVWDLFLRLGIEAEDLVLEINTSGSANAQSAYSAVLKNYLKGKEFELCENCSAQVRARVLNVLRCSKISCQMALVEAPAIVDFLDEVERKQFTDILEALDELSLPYQLNQLYIGPEGATGTNLVIKYKHENQNIVLGEAGHHDSLLKNLSNKSLSSFGFTGSVAGLVKVMELAEVTTAQPEQSAVYLVPLGELASKRSLRLFRDLIAENIKVHDHFGTSGVKNQLKQAEESKARIALIMGQKEAMDEMVILRDVKSGMQEIFSYDKIVIEVKKRLEI